MCQLCRVQKVAVIKLVPGKGKWIVKMCGDCARAQIRFSQKVRPIGGKR